MSSNETVLKAIKFSSTRLVDWVDKAIEKALNGERYVGDRSAFVASAAETLAKRALKGKLTPEKHFLSPRHVPRADDAEEAVRTNVAVPVSALPMIEEAARRLNHHVSPFLAWAALVQANYILDSAPRLPKRRSVVGEVNRRDGKEYVTMTIRYPLSTLKAMDKYREVHQKKTEGRVTRSDVMDKAIHYTIQDRIEDAGIIEILPKNYSLNGGKKMVSFRLSAIRRNEADAAGASMNHNTTGFLVLASSLFLSRSK